MENELKSLIERREFAKALELSEGAADAESLFYRLSALLGLAKSNEAMDLMVAKRAQFFAYNPKATLLTNFELRFLRKEFAEARKDLEFFSYLPYVSQEIEEILRDLPGDIAAQEKRSFGGNKIAEDEILDILEGSDDNFELLSALNALKGKDLSAYAEDIFAVLAKEGVHDDVKTFALLLLVSAKDKKLRKFTLRGENYELTPAYLRPPFTGEPYLETKRLLQEDFSDSAGSKIAVGLLDQTVLALYPRELSVFGTARVLAEAYGSLALNYLGQEDECGEEAKKAKSLIALLLQNNPPLSY
ncbi:MAG: hypothetical protein K6F32_01730 [Bacilli bacterium]|nr:hypothetical protein [Bacilli bacterium]